MQRNNRIGKNYHSASFDEITDADNGHQQMQKPLVEVLMGVLNTLINPDITKSENTRQEVTPDMQD